MKAIKEFYPFARQLAERFIQDIELKKGIPALEDVFKKEKKLVIITNHGPFLGPIAYAIAVAKIFFEHGGAYRTSIGMAHRNLYKIPVMKQCITFMSQLDRPYAIDEVIQHHQLGKFHDFHMMPEGQNTLFSNGVDIQPFSSPKFIEIALMVEAPILIIVHQGSEQWAYPLKIHDKLMMLFAALPPSVFQKINTNKMVSVPLLMKKLPKLKVCYKLYFPRLKLDTLSHSLEPRQEQLWKEANKVRNMMIKMMEQLNREPIGESQ